MITSTNNKQIKHIQLLLEKAKYRRETGLFVAEGIKLFLETPKELVDKVFVSKEFLEKSAHVERVKSHSYEEVETSVFKKMSDTQTPQGILTVVKKPEYDIEKVLEQGDDEKTILILNTIQDPGNIGTMIRCAEAAGVKAILMDKGCADVFSPKVVRSTMGSIYRVPIFSVDDLPTKVKELKGLGYRFFAAHLKGRVYFEEMDYRGNIGIMIGNEGNGLSKELSEAADELVKIPMEGKIESLNAAVSAALFMYEVKRNR